MSRRVSFVGLILVVAIWAVVLLTPQLRLLFAAQVQPLPSWAWWLLPRNEIPVDTLARQHPNDPRVLAAEIEDLSGADFSDDYRKKQLGKYDALIAKFPHEEWLIQNRLRLSVLRNLPIDTGETQSQAKQDESTWLSHDEVLQALKIAERGAQLNPQNSFYDWMRARFLFSLKRDEDALLALRNGADKSRYDDGVLRDTQNRNAVHAMQGPAMWEERATVTAGMLLPHYAHIQKINRAAIWRGVLAERNGNHQRALEIYGAQMNLCRLMWHGSTLSMGRAIARAGMERIWDSPPRRLENTGHKPTTLSSEKIRQNSIIFAAYARKHGRIDLAQSALSDGQMLENSLFSNEFDDMVLGISITRILNPMFMLQWINAILLRALGLCAVAWLLLNVLLRIATPRNYQLQVSLLDITSSTVFIGVASTVVLVSAILLGESRNYWDFAWPLNGSLWGESQNSYLLIAARTFFWLPLVLACIYCGIVMLWRGRRNATLRDDDKQEEPLARAKLILGIAALFIATVTFALLWWFWLSEQGLNNVTEFLGMFLPFLVGGIFYLAGKRMLAARSAHDVIYGFAWSRSTLGALVVVGSMAYFVCTMLALPIRREADARLDDYIKRGEVTLRREAGLTP